MTSLFPPLEGVDYSWGRPGGAALAAFGKRFAVRYVAYPGEGGKALTVSEATDLHGHGIAIPLVFESTIGRALSGKAAGILDAHYALDALDGLGAPALPIYFAVDFDAQAGQQAAIDAYLKGAASVIGPARVGVYGGYGVVVRCKANGSASWFWQTYAWSYGKFAPFAHLYQYLNNQTLNGAAVDLCRAYQSDYGGWTLVPPESSTGDDVDAKTTAPIAVADFSAGSSAYADLASTQQVLVDWTGGHNVGVYGTAKRPKDGLAMDLVRLDLATGDTDLRSLWVGDDHRTSDYRVPAEAARLDAARKALMTVATAAALGLKESAP